MNWQELSLGEVVTFQRGYDLPNSARRNGNIPIVSSSGIIDYHDTAMVRAPGVATGRYGTIGKLFLVEEDYWPLNTTLYVRDFHGNEPRFIFYLLQTFDFESFSGKTGVPGVNRNDLHREFVVLPPLPEQRAIASALADVDALLAALEELLTKKRQLKQGAMQELLTGRTRLEGFEGEWEEVRLGDLGDCLRGVSYSGSDDLYSNDCSDSKTLLRSNNIQEGKLSFADIQHVKAGKVKEDQVLRNGDIVICAANGSRALVGKSALYSLPKSKHTFGAFMACFRPYSPKKTTNFIFYLFNSKSYKDQIDLLLAGSAINNLSPKSLESLTFLVPPLPEQQAIASILSDMDAEIHALDERVGKTRALKQGMMQELLTGRTRLLGE